MDSFKKWKQEQRKQMINSDIYTNIINLGAIDITTKRQKNNGTIMFQPPFYTEYTKDSYNQRYNSKYFAISRGIRNLRSYKGIDPLKTKKLQNILSKVKRIPFYEFNFNCGYYLNISKYKTFTARKGSFTMNGNTILHGDFRRVSDIRPISNRKINGVYIRSHTSWEFPLNRIFTLMQKDINITSYKITVEEYIENIISALNNMKHEVLKLECKKIDFLTPHIHKIEINSEVEELSELGLFD